MVPFGPQLKPRMRESFLEELETRRMHSSTGISVSQTISGQFGILTNPANVLHQPRRANESSTPLRTTSARRRLHAAVRRTVSLLSCTVVANVTAPTTCLQIVTGRIVHAARIALRAVGRHSVQTDRRLD
jgi:hypothetical protein